MFTRIERPLTHFVLASLGLLTLAFGGVVGSRELLGMAERVEDLEARLARAPLERRALEAELAGVREELAAVRAELDDAASAAEAAALLSERVAGAETRLVDIAGAIEAHGSSLMVLTEASSTLAPTFEELLAAQAEEMSARWRGLEERVDVAEDLAAASSQRLDRVDRQLSEGERDVGRMWNDLVGPTVQLAGENSVGSGVVLRSVELSSGGEQGGYATYILTAWHVVRDIVEGDLDMPVPVVVYPEDGSVRQESATLLNHDPVLDVALLQLDSTEVFALGARMASRERLSAVRIFDPVYAVGCPLGNDPIPTPGEVATCHHRVDDQNYWMINAPTYIGNSGGGIFDSATHELLGIFSKIYTHGSLRPTIVPHMGLVTPLTPIYDWLEQVGFGRLVPAGSALAEAR